MNICRSREATSIPSQSQTWKNGHSLRSPWWPSSIQVLRIWVTELLVEFWRFFFWLTILQVNLRDYFEEFIISPAFFAYCQHRDQHDRSCSPFVLIMMLVVSNWRPSETFQMDLSYEDYTVTKEKAYRKPRSRSWNTKIRRGSGHNMQKNKVTAWEISRGRYISQSPYPYPTSQKHMRSLRDPQPVTRTLASLSKKAITHREISWRLPRSENPSAKVMSS